MKCFKSPLRSIRFESLFVSIEAAFLKGNFLLIKRIIVIYTVTHTHYKLNDSC